LGNATHCSGGDRRRCDTPPHPVSWGLELHARSLYVCIVPQEGASLRHRPMDAAPAPVLQAIAPDREGLGVAVECLWTG
jgi:hypothetical protein